MDPKSNDFKILNMKPTSPNTPKSSRQNFRSRTLNDRDNFVTASATESTLGLNCDYYQTNKDLLKSRLVLTSSRRHNRDNRNQLSGNNFIKPNIIASDAQISPNALDDVEIVKKPLYLTVDDIFNIVTKNDSSLKLNRYFYAIPRVLIGQSVKFNFYDLEYVENPVIDYPHIPFNLFIQITNIGLLINNNNKYYYSSEVVPIRQFIYERSIFNKLVTFGYFKMYYSNKIFYHWKAITRKKYFLKSKMYLSTVSLYSQPFYIDIILYIQSAINIIDKNIDLFYYVPKPGIILFSDYMNNQISHIKQKTIEINKALEDLHSYLNEKYNYVISDEMLESYIENIKRYHPYRYLELSKVSNQSEKISDASSILNYKNKEVDWIHLRSIQNIKHKFFKYFSIINYITSYFLQITITKIKDRFWNKLLIFLHGIRCIKAKIENSRKSIKYPEGYWDKSNSFVELDEESLEHSDIIIKPDRFYVNQQWENDGCHLSVSVIMEDQNGNIIDISDNNENNLKSNNLKIKIIPSKQTVLNLVNNLIYTLGKLTESIPTFIYDIPLLRNNLIDRGSKSNLLTSNIYYSFLYTYPVYNYLHGIKKAKNIENYIENIYNQASKITKYTESFNQIINSLLSINILYLIDKNKIFQVIPKLVDIFNTKVITNSTSPLNKNSISDVTTINIYKHNDSLNYFHLIDKNNFYILKKAVNYLLNPVIDENKYKNIKYKNGLIVSFYTLLNQIKQLQVYQLNCLYVNLPTLHIDRCRLCIDYYKKVERVFSFDKSFNMIDYDMMNSTLDSILDHKKINKTDIDIKDEKNLKIFHDYIKMMNNIYIYNDIIEFSNYEDEILSYIYHFLINCELSNKSLVASIDTSSNVIFTSNSMLKSCNNNISNIINDNKAIIYSSYSNTIIPYYNLLIEQLIDNINNDHNNLLSYFINNTKTIENNRNLKIYDNLNETIIEHSSISLDLYIDEHINKNIV